LFVARQSKNKEREREREGENTEKTMNQGKGGMKKSF
jgi:hypothetical protein